VFCVRHSVTRPHSHGSRYYYSTTPSACFIFNKLQALAAEEAQYVENERRSSEVGWQGPGTEPHVLEDSHCGKSGSSWARVPKKLNSFYRAKMCVSAVFAVAWCPTVCPSRSCIVSRRLKISSNFFLVFLDPVAPSIYFFGTQFQGGPLQRGCKIHGGRKIFAMFDLYRRLYRKRERQARGCYRTLIKVMGGGSIRIGSDDHE